MPKLINPVYRGLVPFLLLNYFACWQLTSLFGEEKMNSKKEGVAKKMRENLGIYDH